MFATDVPCQRLSQKMRRLHSRKSPPEWRCPRKEVHSQSHICKGSCGCRSFERESGSLEDRVLTSQDDTFTVKEGENDRCNSSILFVESFNTKHMRRIDEHSSLISRNNKDNECCCKITQCRRFCHESNSHFCSTKCLKSRNASSAKIVHPDDIVRWANSIQQLQCKSAVWKIILVFFIGILSITMCSADSNQCAVGLNTPGRTWPQGDIVLEYGQPLKILCILNQTVVNTAFPGKNASDLVFFRNKKEVDPSYITIINETTISMFFEKPPPADDMYYCKLKLNDDDEKRYEAVCLNKVVIGFKPQEPENFTCVSHNWENLICKWDPVQNYITTRFTLMFKLHTRAKQKIYCCPEGNQKPYSCLWDTSTNPIYRQPYEYYIFILNAHNVLGNVSFQYKFHHFAHVIPAKPVNLSVVNKTTDSVMLQWSIPFPMQNFWVGLHHRIAYQNQWDSQKDWKIINITNDTSGSKSIKTKYYNLTGLKYANTVYDIRVFIKSAVAVGEDKWSQFSDITFRTLPALPGLSPRTDIGSFEIIESNHTRDVYLYWQSIPQYLENGDKFKYHINSVMENGREVSLRPSETTRTYAKFKNITLEKNYHFEIVTINEVGMNKEVAHIFVPSQSRVPHEPIAFTKVAFDGGLYELSWTPPIVDNDVITNYTIFWCDNERDRPYQCTGYLDWVHVPKTATIYNVTVPDPNKVYQFAISANTERSSTGMIWASCTVIHNKVVEKLKTVWINRIGSDFIEVGWKLGCSDRIDIVEGFNIYYCPIISPFNLNCKEPKMKTTIKADPHTIHGIVHGLKPYTTYSLSVAVLMKSGEGLHSDPLYNTTLEAAPSNPPYKVTVRDVTDTSMVVRWETPHHMNGVLRYYEVLYNDQSVKVEEGNQVKLSGLAKNHNYSINVVACTVSCSRKSQTVYQTTKIGVPGKISVPNVRFINSSQVIVMWSKPEPPSGRLDYYEISVSDGVIQTSNRTDAQVPIPDCKTIGREQVYQFRVRAVNIAENNVHLRGPWSEPGVGNCYSDGPSYRVLVILWVIGSLSAIAVLLCVAYSSKRMWKKCKAMQDVEVELPPGLAPSMKLLNKAGEQHIRQSSADSSGCSSGQDSVTSSLTSDSQVSSDSGTEIDPVAVSPNKVLESAPAWEFSSLRQRNVGMTKPGVSTDTARWDAYVKVAKTGDTVLGDTLSLARSTPNLTDSTGCATSQQTWSSTGYISMPSSEELSSNPSPMPKETSTPGGYSVVGAVAKPLRPKSEDVSDLSSSKPMNPYITLSAVDQQPKGKRIMNALGDFHGLTFTNSDKPKTENLPPFTASDKTSKPYVQTGLLDSFKRAASLTDKDHKTSFTSPSLIDSCKKPYVSAFASPVTLAQSANDSKPYVAVSSIASQPDSRNKSFPMTFAGSTMLTQKKPDCSSKPYVAVSSISDVIKPVSTASTEPSKKPVSMSSTASTKPYVLATTAQSPMEPSRKSFTSPVTGTSEGMPKPYVPTTTVFQTLQQQQQQQKGTLDVPMSDKEAEGVVDDSKKVYSQHQTRAVTSTKGEPEKPLTVVKHDSGYVTITENPNLEQQVPSTVASSYVQHACVEKSLPLSSQSDEQYSKVTVVPSTIQ